MTFFSYLIVIALTPAVARVFLVLSAFAPRRNRGFHHEGASPHDARQEEGSSSPRCHWNWTSQLRSAGLPFCLLDLAMLFSSRYGSWVICWFSKLSQIAMD
eukprot:g4569.t1